MSARTPGSKRAKCSPRFRDRYSTRSSAWAALSSSAGRAERELVAVASVREVSDHPGRRAVSSGALPDVESVLPHRHPFLLLDELVAYEPGFLVARKRVSGDEPYFAGHFPGSPILPGVLMVEMMAQTGAALGRLDRDDTGESLKPGKIGAIRSVRFLQSCYPGDELVIEARVHRRVGPIADVASVVRRAGLDVAVGHLVLVSP